MTWVGWMLVAIYTIDVIYGIAAIGVDRKPLSQGDVVFKLVGNAALVVAVLTVGTGRL